MKRFLAILAVLGLSGLLVACGVQTGQSQSQTNKMPIIMVGGYGSNQQTFNDFVQTVRHKTAVNDVTAVIQPSGKIQYTGDLNVKHGQPLIRVVFSNDHSTVKRDAQWLAALLVQLKTKYHFQQYAALGHSMGSVALVYQALMLSHRQQPTLKRLVTVAGHFNGWMDEGIPGVDPGTNRLNHAGCPKIQSSEYRAMAKQSQRMKKVHVLNIVGDVRDGSASDTRVTTVSAHSLKYLLRNDPYLTTLDIKGKRAQHSALRHNQQVLQAASRWLLEGELK